MRFDVSELNTLAVDMGLAAGQIGAKAATVIRKTAYAIERDAKVFSPVDTGNLRSSISTSFEGDGRFAVLIAEIGPTADYARFVEEGTSVNAPQAFMGPALDRNTPGFVAGMEQIVGDIL